MKKNKGCPPANSRKESYVQFKKLSFLKSLYETESSEAYENESEEEAENIATQTSQILRQTAQTPRPTKKDIVSEEDDTLQLSSKMEKSTIALKEDDPDMHFFMSLLHFYRMMPDTVKLNLQMEFLNLIKKYELHISQANYITCHINRNCTGPSSYPQLPNQSIQLTNITSTLSASNTSIGSGDVLAKYSSEQPIIISSNPISSNVMSFEDSDSNCEVIEIIKNKQPESITKREV